MQGDDIWAEILTAASNRAPCSDESSTCWLDIRYTPWYASFQHGDVAPHDCGLCNPAVLPTRIVSRETVQSIKREVLVARIALFLAHAHEPSLSSAAGADGAAADGNTPSASTTSGTTAGSAASPDTRNATDCAAA